MAKLTHVNIPLTDLNGSWAPTAKIFFHLKALMVQAGWKVIGTSDGQLRWACEGNSAPLPPEERGSGGEYDCWVTPDTTGSSVPGAPNQRAWVCLEEPEGGKGRQWTFQLSNQRSGYAIIAYNRAGDADVSTASLTQPPGIGSGRFILGSSFGGVGSIFVGEGAQPTTAHLFAYDDAQNEAFAWGLYALHTTSQPRAYLAQTVLAPDSPHLDHDEDRVAICYSFSSSSTTPPSPSTTYRYKDYGLPTEEWRATIWGTESYWLGGGPIDSRDDLDRISRPLVYQGANNNTRQYVGAIDRGLRVSGRDLSYPLLGRDQHGQVWVWMGSGVLWPWVDGDDPPPPLIG